MVAAVRKHAPSGVLVIAGALDYAYDATTAIALDKKLTTLSQQQNIMYNFHPYMGTYQQGDTKKNADGFESMVIQMQAGTDAPLIVTEFGQFCCDTHGSCYDYDGSWNGQQMGYDEAIVKISDLYGVSWTPWSWRPGGIDGGNQCQDVNALNGGTSLAHPTDGKGADWLGIWETYANKVGGDLATV